MERRVRYNR